MARPDTRIVLKHKETGEYVSLIAIWRNPGAPTGARFDGRVRGISVKYEDDAGKVRTIHAAAGPDGHWWVNVYEGDRDGRQGENQRAGNDDAAAAKGKPKGTPKGKAKAAEVDDDIPF